MLINVTESIQTTKQVEIELPFYYKSSYWADYPGNNSETFGRVTEKCVTTIDIEEGQGNDLKKFTIETEPLNGIKDISYSISSYLKPEYVSTEAEFLDALEQTKQFLNKL